MRLNRYLLKQILPLLIIGVAIFTFLLITAQLYKLIELLITGGAGLAELGVLFGYLMVPMLVFSLPISFFMASILAFVRLSSDSELIAMAAAGIGPRRLLRPVLQLGAVLFVVSALLNIWGQPASMRAMQREVRELIRTRFTHALQPGVYFQRVDDFLLYFENVTERERGKTPTLKVENLMLVDRREMERGRSPHLVAARRGEVEADPESLTLRLRLSDGRLYFGGGVSSLENRDEVTADFREMRTSFDLRDYWKGAGLKPSKPQEMSWRELRYCPGADNRLEECRVEAARRVALPFSIWGLALLALPLGTRFARSGRGGGLAAGMLILVGYYVLHIAGQNLAADGLLNPWIGLNLPNLACIGLGIYLFRRLDQRRY